MRGIILFWIVFWLSNCDKTVGREHTVPDRVHYLHDVRPYTADSLVQVVIEIPAGTTQKWELNKESGQIEWEQVGPDSFRVINYLPYPANYGFIPQTRVDEAAGGDGDPVDVFVLGTAVDRETIVHARIIGIVHLLDDHESDPKLLAVNTGEPGYDIHTFESLTANYPGAVDIITLWLQHYKGSGRIRVLSVNDETHALGYLKSAHLQYLSTKTN